VKHFDHPQLRLAFDCYQQQRDSGNLIWNLVAHHSLYPVIHIADVPTGQEPGTGEINFPSLRTTLRELAFDGYVGLAFKPSTTEAEALARTRKIFPLE
jgi:hydroxypyruvate isomerase